MAVLPIAHGTSRLQDKNERVRRRVIATLGELLFYIATQQQDTAAAAGAGGAPPADPAVVWGINGNTYAQVRLQQEWYPYAKCVPCI